MTFKTEYSGSGAYKDATKWRTFNRIDWRHPIKSYLKARERFKGFHHVRIKIVRSNKKTKTGEFVYQVDGYELPNGDFK